jgi:hypothetical protein
LPEQWRDSVDQRLMAVRAEVSIVRHFDRFRIGRLQSAEGIRRIGYLNLRRAEYLAEIARNRGHGHGEIIRNEGDYDRYSGGIRFAADALV